ncbi:MAG: GtrA family protein [Anaerolineae bacterium]|nr:GtrA family protein [Anaerolineae bacterium]
MKNNNAMYRIANFGRANSKEITRFLKFATVGMLGTVIDFGILNLLILTFGFSKILANTCSFTVAVFSNFIWNRLWTFPESRDRPIAPQLAQFVLVNIGGLLLNQAIFLSLDAWVLGGAGVLAAPMATLALNIGLAHYKLAYNLSKAIATIIVLFWNFGANRLWTFGGI